MSKTRLQTEQPPESPSVLLHEEAPDHLFFTDLLTEEQQEQVLRYQRSAHSGAAVMRALMAPHELCTCTLEREALLERAGAGEGVLALLLPLSDPPQEIEPRVRHGDAISASVSPVKLAERFIRLRRKCDTIFGDRLFADPAWDMMLDLFQTSQKNSRPISVTRLCIASAVPNTTALRWMDTLVRKGLLVRHEDERDRRRTFVSLTDEASRKMHEVLSYWEEMG